ncbi:hypothetical protein ACFCXC_23930 [Streptomyces microflavus]
MVVPSHRDNATTHAPPALTTAVGHLTIARLRNVIQLGVPW